MECFISNPLPFLADVNLSEVSPIEQFVRLDEHLPEHVPMMETTQVGGFLYAFLTLSLFTPIAQQRGGQDLMLQNQNSHQRR